MKKIFLVLAFLLAFSFNLDVNAASSRLYVSSIGVESGQSFTVYVDVKDAAAWNVHVSASGPVSGCAINQADASADAMNTSRTFEATCTANGVGSINITLSGDITSEDGNSENISGSVRVNVTNPTVDIPQQPTNPPKPYTPPGGQTTPTETKSNNNDLDRIVVNGVEATKSGNEYVMELSNYVEKVNIVGFARDEKATVSEVGEKSLNVGDNNFSITITAESGTPATYWLNIKRGEYNYLNDLPELLNVSDKIDIKLNSEDTLSKETIERISKSGKTVTLNRYDDKFLLYSWILNGKEIKDMKNFNPNIETKANDKIEKTLNYAEGLYLDFTSCGVIPAGTVLRYNISRKYQKEDLVNIYVYEPKSNTMAYIKRDTKVADDFLEFGDIELNRYFITKAILNVKDYDLSEKSLGALIISGKGSIIPIILAAVFGLSTIGLIAYIIISKNKRKIVVSDVDVLDTGDVGIPLEIKQEGYNEIEHLSADATPSSNNEKEEEIIEAVEEVGPPLKTDVKEVLKDKSDDLEDFAKTISLELDAKTLEEDTVKPALKKEEHKEIKPLNNK